MRVSNNRPRSQSGHSKGSADSLFEQGTSSRKEGPTTTPVRPPFLARLDMPGRTPQPTPQGEAKAGQATSAATPGLDAGTARTKPESAPAPARKVIPHASRPTALSVDRIFAVLVALSQRENEVGGERVTLPSVAAATNVSLSSVRKVGDLDPTYVARMAEAGLGLPASYVKRMEEIGYKPRGLTNALSVLPLVHDDGTPVAGKVEDERSMTSSNAPADDVAKATGSDKSESGVVEQPKPARNTVEKPRAKARQKVSRTKGGDASDLADAQKSPAQDEPTTTPAAEPVAVIRVTIQEGTSRQIPVMSASLDEMRGALHGAMAIASDVIEIDTSRVPYSREMEALVRDIVVGAGGRVAILTGERPAVFFPAANDTFASVTAALRPAVAAPAEDIKSEPEALVVQTEVAVTPEASPETPPASKSPRGVRRLWRRMFG